MTDGRKVKLSVSLSADLLERIDHAAARLPGSTRSSVIEAWLRSAARAAAEASLASEVIAYYEARTPAERAEDEGMARGLSAAARRVRDGDDEPTGHKRVERTALARKKRR